MKKKILIGIGAVLAVALLAGAAFIAVRLMNAKAADGSGPLLAGLGSKPGGGQMSSMNFQIIPAPEIPLTSPDVVGQVVNIKDNSIFVSEFEKSGSGGNAVTIGVGGDTGPSTQNGGETTPTPSGPTTEVVISKETVIYRDATMNSAFKPPENGSNMVIQQKVEAVDISQIAQDFMVQVWGQKRGDRLIADTIVVMGAAVIQAKEGVNGK